MAKQFAALETEHQNFIARQRLYFVASAARDGRVNVSPKGSESLRVLAPDRLLWMNLTGSGNETAAHIRDLNRITLLWCAFEGPPLILRVYGSARAVHPHDAEWQDCARAIPPPTGARQYFMVDVDLVQTSCGYGVPLYEYQGERDALRLWAEKRGNDGIAAYWQEKNVVSIDGLETGILPSGPT